MYLYLYIYPSIYMRLLAARAGMEQVGGKHAGGPAAVQIHIYTHAHNHPHPPTPPPTHTTSLARSRWAASVEEAKRLRVVAGRVLLRWEHASVAPAFARWSEQAADGKRLRRAATKVAPLSRPAGLTSSWT